MAGVCTDDSSMVDDDSLIQVSKRDLTCLLLHVISATGEIEKIKYEHNQLENGTHGSSQGRNYSTASQETCEEDGSQFNIDMATERNDKKNISSINNLEHTVLGSTQAQAQGLNARDSKTETFMHYKEGNKSRDNNFFDLGFENKTKNLTDGARTSRTFLNPSNSDPAFFNIVSFLTSNEDNLSSANFPGKSDSLPRTTSTDHGIECDGISLSSVSPNKNAVISGSGRIQSGNYQRGQLYSRTLSSRQDERPKKKGMREMTKTGSHDSYFPIDSKSNVPQPFPKFNYRQVGRSNISPVSPVIPRKQDNLMTSAFSHLISKNIFDCVNRELRRVKTEYHKLEQKNKEITDMHWHKDEEVRDLKEELRLLKVKMEERESTSKEQAWTKSDEEETLRIMLIQTQKEVDNMKKINAELENMLSDERTRFNRDEEQFKKQIETLKKRPY